MISKDDDGFCGTQNLRLLRKANRFGDESMRGYMWRMAEINGISSPHSLCRQLNLFDSRHWSITNYVKFGRMLGIKSNDINMQLRIRSIASLGAMRRVPFKSKRFGRSYNYFCYPDDKSVNDQRKICSDCLIENIYHRHQWEITSYSICEIHQIFLIDQCGVCKRRLDWFSGALSQCSCGFDLRNSQRYKAKPDIYGFYIHLLNFSRNRNSVIRTEYLPELYCIDGAPDAWEIDYRQRLRETAQAVKETLEEMQFPIESIQNHSIPVSNLADIEDLRMAFITMFLPELLWVHEYSSHLRRSIGQSLFSPGSNIVSSRFSSQ